MVSWLHNYIANLYLYTEAEYALPYVVFVLFLFFVFVVFINEVNFSVISQF